MSIPGSASPLFFTAAAADAAVTLEKSVRFNSGDSAYLNRTPSSAGSNTTWTLSTWVKKTGNDNHIFGAGAGNTPGRFGFGFNGSDKIFAFVIASSSTVFSITTDAVFRDPAGWYHIVLIADTGNSTQADRFKIYVNGVLQSVSGTLMPSSQNTFVNTTAAHTFGRRSYTAADYFNGYLASTILVDGTAKDVTDFGAFDDNGVWQAAAYSGTFGTNGFHLFDFANESGIGDDASGNDNDFTVNNITSDAGTTGVSRIWSSGDSDWTITGSGQYASKSSTSTYADVFSNLLSPGTLYGFTVDIPDGDSNGGWWLGDSNSTSLSGTHPNQGRGSNSIGMRGRSASPDNDTMGVHGTFATANSVTAGDSALSGFQSINPYGATEIDFVVDRINHKCWVKAASNSSWIKGGDPTNPNSTPSFYLPSTGDMYFGFNQYDDQTNLEITQFSVTQSGGTGTDVLFDSPTNGDSSDDTGAGGEVSANYCTLNPLDKATVAVLSDGNLRTNSSGAGAIRGTFKYPKTGKWYYEVQPIDDAQYNTGYFHVGIATADSNLNASPGYDTTNEFTYWQNGSKTNNVAYGASFTAGDIIGVAFDAGAGSLTFYKNGVSQGVNSTGLTGEYFPYAPTWNYNAAYNFGQRSFAYPVSNYLPLSTTNLPTPTIADGSTAFDAKLYTGNNTTNAISGYEFSPDFLWLKRRDAAANNTLFDTVRGRDSGIFSNTTSAEVTGSPSTNDLVSFDSTGFTLGAAYNHSINSSTGSYVAFAWDAGSSTVSNTDGSQTSQVRVNQTAGFSIATFNTPNPSATFTYGHGLNAAPEFVIHKFLYGSNWYTYHAGLGQPFINLNDASTPGSNQFTTAPTSSVFTYPAGLIVGPDLQIVAYSFTSVAGYSMFGAYDGNSSSDGPFIYTGFRPAWLLIRRSNGSANWYLVDSTRDPDNTVNLYLKPNASSAEIDTSSEGTKNYIDFLSNGFKLRGTEISTNASQEYIYAAFAENPFQANGGLAR